MVIVTFRIFSRAKRLCYEMIKIIVNFQLFYDIITIIQQNTETHRNKTPIDQIAAHSKFVSLCIIL